MNRDYWETVAADYEQEVLSVFDHDEAGFIRTRIAAAGAATPGAHAADLGCGVGKFTPLLADTFAHVQACDRSERGMAETRIRCGARTNIDFVCFDLASEPPPFVPVDFVLCVNVLIMPELDERRRAWRAVTNQVAQGGTLLLVVPSLESVQFGYFAALEACLHAGNSCMESLRRTAPDGGSVEDVHHGVHRLDGLRTKHYLREELENLLSASEFDLGEIAKLAYASPGGTSSWDWLVTARRR